MKKKPLTGRARSMENLQKGRQKPLPVVTASVTAISARSYVKMRASGISADAAVRSLEFGTHTDKQWATLRREWDAHALVGAAWDDWQGATWADLEANRRIELAIDITVAQCAYYLATSDFASPNADVRKITEARTVLQAKLDAAANAGSMGKFEGMLRDILNKSAGTAAPEKPQWGDQNPGWTTLPSITKPQ